MLMHALKLHDHTIRKTLEDPSLADYPLDDLSLLARYFDRQDLFNEALRVLDILFTRADLPEEQRRRFIAPLDGDPAKAGGGMMTRSRPCCF